MHMPMKLYKYICSLHPPPWERQITFWLRISFSTGKKFERPGARQLGLCNMCLCMSKKESRHVCEACVHVNSCFPLPLFPRVKTIHYRSTMITSLWLYIYICKLIHVCNFILCQYQYHYCITLSDLIFFEISKTEFARLVLYPTTMCWLQRHLFHHFTILAEKMLDKLSAIGVGNKGHRERRKNCHFCPIHYYIISGKVLVRNCLAQTKISYYPHHCTFIARRPWESRDGNA